MEVNRKSANIHKGNYRSTNREMLAEKGRVYYKVNKALIITKVREYRNSNKEKLSEKDKKDYQAHKDSVSHRVKVWGRANYDKLLERNHRRRALKAGAIGDHHTASQFRDLCYQTGNICLCCKQSKKLTADHVVPLSKGGSDGLENIQPLCSTCNISNCTKTIDYRR